MAFAIACLAAMAPARAATLSEPEALVAEVFALADARLALMPDVAAAKWLAGQPVTDRAREEQSVRTLKVDVAAEAEANARVICDEEAIESA